MCYFVSSNRAAVPHPYRKPRTAAIAIGSSRDDDTDYLTVTNTVTPCCALVCSGKRFRVSYSHEAEHLANFCT